MYKIYIGFGGNHVKFHTSPNNVIRYSLLEVFVVCELI